MKRFHTTLRTRLALIYGILFPISGAVTVFVTWLFIGQQTNNGISFIRSDSPVVITKDENLPPDEIAKILEQANARLANVQHETLTGVVTQGTVIALIIGVIAIGIGWLVVGRMLRPLTAITDTARRIANAPDADRRMHERIALQGPRDEIIDLATTFDKMLDRIDKSFESQRKFVANASHELRTPLTINRALIEVAVSRPKASDDVKLLGETLLSINSRHERLIEGLLLLARSGSNLNERNFLDLADIANHVIEESADPSPIRVSLDAEESPTIGDSVLLEQMIRNLYQNAVQHNRDHDSWISIKTKTSADKAVVVVRNSGAVIAPYDIPSMVEPFRQLKQERTGNNGNVGLGLSIVKSIVEAHDGILTLAPEPEGGLNVKIELPVAHYATELESDLSEVH